MKNAYKSWTERLPSEFGKNLGHLQTKYGRGYKRITSLTVYPMIGENEILQMLLETGNRHTESANKKRLVYRDLYPKYQLRFFLM